MSYYPPAEHRKPKRLLIPKAINQRQKESKERESARSINEAPGNSSDRPEIEWCKGVGKTAKGMSRTVDSPVQDRPRLIARHRPARDPVRTGVQLGFKEGRKRKSGKWRSWGTGTLIPPMRTLDLNNGHQEASELCPRCMSKVGNDGGVYN